MGTNFDVWGQTFIFEKWDFNDKNSCFYEITNIFNEGVSPEIWAFFKNKISLLDINCHVLVIPRLPLSL